MIASSAQVHSSHSSKIRVFSALLVFVIALVLYTFTLAPTVTLVDSGELIVASRTLGVAHPPGFPLYVLLAHLATLVPIGSIAVRVNFASAVFAALASAVLTLVVLQALENSRLSPPALPEKKKGRKKGKKQEPSKPDDSTDTSPAILFAISSMAGLSLAFSRTLWSYATIAEVYTLNAFLILVIFLLMFSWRRGLLEYRARNERPDGQRRASPNDRLLYIASLVFGIALGVHHVTVGLMLPALAVLVMATEGLRFFASRRLLYAALISTAGLVAVYAYLPIAASMSPKVNWGDPRTFERLVWHVTGKQYQGFFEFSLRSMTDHLGEFFKLAAREFGPRWLPALCALAAAGLIRLFRRDKTMFWFLTCVIAADQLYASAYDIAEDKDAYYLPTFIALAIAAAFGAVWFTERLVFARPRLRAAPYLAAGLLLLVPLTELAANVRYDNRRRYFIAQDYVDNILSTMEPGAMLLTRDWQVYSPMLYSQEIEHRRNDAIIIDVNQLRRSWYYDYLKKVYPGVIDQARDKVEAFLEDLRHWEHDPDLFQRDITLNHRIDSRFYDMIIAFVTNHIRSAPVYVTLDIAANREGVDAKLTESLTASYQFIPQGLVFKMGSQQEFTADPQLVTRGLADGTLEFEDDDVVKLKVLPVYVTMLYNRGRYLAAIGRHEQAIESFKQSLKLQPGLAVAQQAIDESQNAIRRGGSTSRSP